MKRILLFLMLLFAVSSYGQSGSNRYTAGINYTVGVPTFVPQGNVSKVAIDTGTMKWYEYSQVGGWRWSGDRVQDISGCSAPAYTPGKAQSRLVLNNCTEAQNGHGPELYKYTGTEWLCLNCVTGGGGVYTGGEGIVVDSPSIRIDTLDRLSFATSPTLPGGVGTIRWNDTDGTIEVGMKGGNVTQQIGQEQLVLVKHADNSGLANGNVVYVVGSDGANKTVRLARADAESTSANTFGVMTEAATGGNKAFCTTFGLVRDLNTSALTEGAMVWLSSTTAGAMTTTRPTAPNHAVQIGFCIRSHATQGIIFVSVQNGYELGELHDVTITSPANNQILQYNSAGSQWVNATLSVLAAGNTGEVQYNNAGSFAASSGLTWTPNTLTITGSGTGSDTRSFLARNSSNQTGIDIKNNGDIHTRLGAFVLAADGRIYTNRVEARNPASGGIIELTGGHTGVSSINFNTWTTVTKTSGEYSLTRYATSGFQPTSGTAAFIFQTINGVINQTGGANGITRGLRITPTLTSAADWRSIEYDNNSGWGIYGSGTAKNYIEGSVSIGSSITNSGAKLEVKSTTGIMVPPNMTSTQRDAIASPPNGIIYNTTTGKFQGYAASTWVDLH